METGYNAIQIYTPFENQLRNKEDQLTLTGFLFYSQCKHPSGITFAIFPEIWFL
jgi:hypothetical protein